MMISEDDLADPAKPSGGPDGAVKDRVCLVALADNTTHKKKEIINIKTYKFVLNKL